jgi:hypothetical protein
MVSHSQRFSLLFDDQVSNEEEENEDQSLVPPEMANYFQDPDADNNDFFNFCPSYLVENKQINKSYDIVFKLKGCFQFMKKDIHQALSKEWEQMLIRSHSPTHMEFFNSFFPSNNLHSRTQHGSKSHLYKTLNWKRSDVW